MTEERMPPVHPGEILHEDFMKPQGISINALARSLRVPANRVSAIVNGKRGITPDTAMRLSIFFGTTPDVWLNLQMQYDIEVAEMELREKLTREVIPFSEQ
jgi:addiction module HigA family antidote